MSNFSQRRVRPGVLAVLGVSTLTSMLLVAPAFAGEAHLDGLASASTHQRFIVKYRDSAAPAEASVLARSLKSAAAAVPARAGRGVGLQKLRDLAIGPAVIQADRELDQAEAA